MSIPPTNAMPIGDPEPAPDAAATPPDDAAAAPAPGAAPQGPTAAAVRAQIGANADGADFRGFALDGTSWGSDSVGLTGEAPNGTRIYARLDTDPSPSRGRLSLTDQAGTIERAFTADERRAFTEALAAQVAELHTGPAFDPGSQQEKVLDILRAGGNRTRTDFDDFRASFLGNIAGKPLITGQSDTKGTVYMTYDRGELREVDSAAGGHPRPLSTTERDALSRAIQHQLAQGTTAIDPAGLRQFLRDARLVAPGAPLPTPPAQPLETAGGGS
jgi:hypothetical protein